MFTPSFTPGSEHSLLFKRMEGQAMNFNPTSTQGDKIHPWGTTSPWGSQSLPLGAKLRMGLWAAIQVKGDGSNRRRRYLQTILLMHFIY
jgi:hypothetical protein